MILEASAAVAAALYVRGFIRLRRRGRADLAGAWRAAFFAAGLSLILVPSISPIDETLSGHMLEHVLIGDVAPALLVLSLRGPLLAFTIPAPVIRFSTRRLRGLLACLGRPWVAASVWAVAMAAWHVPAAYDAAVARPWLHALEHATFLAVGLLVWAVLLDPARTGRVSVAARASLAGAVFLLGQLLCGVLLLSPPLYTAYVRVVDQQYAALLMMAEQLLVLGTFLVLLGATVMRAPSGSRAS
jgi:cytochrome c oxidase assembly factor CtaG